ncbi:hypothetical protein [Azospirillum argentinense]
MSIFPPPSAAAAEGGVCVPQNPQNHPQIVDNEPPRGCNSARAGDAARCAPPPRRMEKSRPVTN